MFSIFTALSGRNIILVLLVFLNYNAGFAQSLLWSKLSDIHSTTASAGINPNSLIDDAGNIIYVSVEKDILHFYKYDENGSELAHLNTGENIGAFTKLIQLASGNFAIAFDHTPLEV